MKNYVPVSVRIGNSMKSEDICFVVYRFLIYDLMKICLAIFLRIDSFDTIIEAFTVS